MPRGKKKYYVYDCLFKNLTSTCGRNISTFHGGPIFRILDRRGSNTATRDTYLNVGSHGDDVTAQATAT